MSAERKSQSELGSDNAPQAPYFAKTDFDRNLVEISVPGYKSVEIEIPSLSSVSNMLSTFWGDPDARLHPEAILKIEDKFSGKSTAVTVESLRDIGKVFDALLKGAGQAPVKAAPSVTPAAPAVSSEEPTTAAKAEEPRRRGRPRKAVAEGVTGAMPAPTAAPSAPTSTEPKRRGRPKKVPEAARAAAKSVATPAVSEAAEVSRAAPGGVTTPEATPKKRGRPKKAAAEATNKTAATEARKVAATAEAAPKRRGRPKRNAAEVYKPQAAAAPTEASSEPKKRGRPKKTQSTILVGAEAPATAASATPKRRGRPPKSATPAKSQRAKSTPSKAAAPAAGKKRGRPSKADLAARSTVSSGEMPEWFKPGLERIEGNNPEYGSFELVKTPLIVEPAGSHNVTGSPAAGQTPTAWGYEVKSGDRHLAWVVADADGKFYLTGVAGDGKERSSGQSSISSVIARVATRVMPKVGTNKQAAA